MQTIKPTQLIPQHILVNSDGKNVAINYEEWGTDGKKVIKVYHYLYRFSIDRLYMFREDIQMITLFRYYVENHLI